MEKKKTVWRVDGREYTSWESCMSAVLCLSKKQVEEQQVEVLVEKANGVTYKYSISRVYKDEFKKSNYMKVPGFRIIADFTVETSDGECHTYPGCEFWAGLGMRADWLLEDKYYLESYAENLYDAHRGVRYLAERYDNSASGYRGRFHDQGSLFLRPSQMQTEGLFLVKGQIENRKVNLTPKWNAGYADNKENVIRLVKVFEGTIEEYGEVKTGKFFYYMDEDGNENCISYMVDVTENEVFKAIEFSDLKYVFYNRQSCAVTRGVYVPEKKAVMIPNGTTWGGDWTDPARNLEDFWVTSLEHTFVPVKEELFYRTDWALGRRCDYILERIPMPKKLVLNNGLELKEEKDGYYTSVSDQENVLTVYMPIDWEETGNRRVEILSPTSTSLLRPTQKKVAQFYYDKESLKVRYRYKCQVEEQEQEIYLSFAPNESLFQLFSGAGVVSFQNTTGRCADLTEQTGGKMEEYVKRFGTEEDAVSLKKVISKYLALYFSALKHETVGDAWNRLNAKELLDELEHFCAMVAENLAVPREEEKENLLEEHIMIKSLPEAFLERQKIDKNTVAMYEELAYASEGYKETGNVPNFAIAGPPGVGKTTLANAVAKDVFGKEIKICTPSELKGSYVGHTRKVVLNVLSDVYENGKILMIDEAYDVYSDTFGREAMTVLLPILSGDQCEFEWTDDITDRNNAIEKRLVLNEGEKITVWLAGYEHEMRKMLSENPGLYRRMRVLSLPTPQVATLYNTLLKIVSSSLKKFIEEHVGKEINNFIGWATGRDFSEYFANYAGVKSLAKDLKYLWEKILLKEYSDEDRKNEVIRFLESRKKEINEQYKAVLLEKNKSDFLVETDCNVTLDNVKGYKDVCERIRVTANMLTSYEAYEKIGIAMPKGALLVGPPGTGKTSIARALAGEVQKRYNEGSDKEKRVAFIAVAATEILTQDRVKALFEQAREYDTCILFIDEIDAIGKQRMQSNTSSALIQLMKELDGFDQNSRIYILAATNAPEVLDPALKRPGRFDAVIKMELPDKEDRKVLLESFLEKNNLWNELTDEEMYKSIIVEKVARLTLGFSPAELKALVNEAAIEYYTIGKEGLDEFESALLEMIDRRIVGERHKKESASGEETQKENSLQPGERKNTGAFAIAAHEVGHALVNILENGGKEPFEKITIVPRGNTLGFVMRKPQEEPMMTRSEMLSQIRVCLGGRAVEEIIFGYENVSAGAVEDIYKATEIARSMVFDYGMSKELGPMALRRRTHSYLETETVYLCSEAVQNKAESEVQKILFEEMRNTMKLLEERKDMIEKLSALVVERETMSGEEFLAEYKNLGEA